MKSLLRCRRFYDTKAIVRLYECQVLSFLETTSVSVAHVAPSVLKPIDELQEHFLSEIGLM